MKHYTIALCNKEILINDDFTLPQAEQINVGDDSRYIHVGTTGNATYRAIRLTPDEAEHHNSLVRSEIRPMYKKMPDEQFTMSGKGLQMIHWDEHSRFCPSCGTSTVPFLSNAKKCPSCGYEIFPMIAPAAIVLVSKGDEILMVRARNFRSDNYGLVAGFLEVGETLEECVRRELREEVGIEIKDLTYFGSQPWPFPSGVMIGYTAEYLSGEITLQEDELTHGAFFHYNNLPKLPGKMSIARQMIDAFVKAKTKQ